MKKGRTFWDYMAGFHKEGVAHIVIAVAFVLSLVWVAAVLEIIKETFK